jgi:hypothetical protein
MDSDILNFFGVMMTLVVTGVAGYAGIVLVAGLQRRVSRGTVLRERVAELETRLDFAERLLSQRSEASRIGGNELPG